MVLHGLVFHCFESIWVFNFFLPIDFVIVGVVGEAYLNERFGRFVFIN